ncbi:MAG: hypothetical protein LC792_13880, partial [Actinobacteria bacterium]|nr:hypothetical protein [Actinomycetota bacterium]
RRRRPPVTTTVAILLTALIAGACGSNDSPTVGGAQTATSAPTTGPTTSPIPTIPFTFPPTSIVPFVAGDGTLAVTGDTQATARFSSTSCAGITVTEVHGILASLVYVSDPGAAAAKSYVLDVAGLSPGKTTFPEPAGFNQQPPRRIRLTTADSSAWGTTAAGEGMVSGTLTTTSASAKAGTYDLQLGFVGTGTGHGAVHVSGGWTCP